MAKGNKTSKVATPIPSEDAVTKEAAATDKPDAVLTHKGRKEDSLRTENRNLRKELDELKDFVYADREAREAQAKADKLRADYAKAARASGLNTPNIKFPEFNTMWVRNTESARQMMVSNFGEIKSGWEVVTVNMAEEAMPGIAAHYCQSRNIEPKSLDDRTPFTHIVKTGSWVLYRRKKIYNDSLKEDALLHNEGQLDSRRLAATSYGRGQGMRILVNPEDDESSREHSPAQISVQHKRIPAQRLTH